MPQGKLKNGCSTSLLQKFLRWESYKSIVSIVYNQQGWHVLLLREMSRQLLGFLSQLIDSLWWNTWETNYIPISLSSTENRTLNITNWTSACWHQGLSNAFSIPTGLMQRLGQLPSASSYEGAASSFSVCSGRVSFCSKWAWSPFFKTKVRLLHPGSIRVRWKPGASPKDATRHWGSQIKLLYLKCRIGVLIYLGASYLSDCWPTDKQLFTIQIGARTFSHALFVIARRILIVVARLHSIFTEVRCDLNAASTLFM